MPQYPAVIDLSSLTGSNGFKISGEAAGDYSGFSVASAGDVNGDGFADLIIGAPFADPNGTVSGSTYVVFGKASGFSATLLLSSLTGSNGFKINGEAALDVSGRSVASAGDINGDGFADIIIGAFGASPNGVGSGASYVVFGKASGFTATLELSSLNGSNGFQINGEAAGDNAGYSVSSAGDINGDGFADLLIGAYNADPNGTSSGATYVVFGKASGFAATLELSSLNGSTGFQINGEAAYDYSGRSVAAAGDVNGDGFADLIIGAYGADPNGAFSGAAYVRFGKATAFNATIELSNLSGPNGFQINGEAAGDSAGFSVSSAGDINGDGFGDLIVGAPYASPNGLRSGAAYVVFGKASGFSANLELSSLNGSNGFQINGEALYDVSGFAVSSAGDINGDGFGDLIIGAFYASYGTSSGASYVVFGKASGFGATLELSSLDGSNGFQLNGVSSKDYAGFSVSSAGDVNGDGLTDLIIGAYGADTKGFSSGASYVVFGRLPDASVNRAGTVASQTLVGGNFNDTLSGLAGNDKLFGHGGNDTLDGGAGIDTARFYGARSSYTITRNGTVTIVGPDGTDTLTGIEKAVFDDQTVLLGQGPSHIDFNSDLNADVLWQSSDGTPAVWLLNGFVQLGGSFVGSNPGPSWHVRGAGDFNGDGKSDILWQNDSGQVAIWTMDGFTQLGGSFVGSNPGSSWHVRGAGDFNGDGKSDILWQNDSGQAAIWTVDGFTQLGGSFVGSNPGSSWHVRGAGDFNGDGKSDILWQNDSGQVAIWTMDGFTQLGGSLVGSNPGSSWHVRGAGDFNGDGKSDILWQDDSGQVSIWTIDGFTQLGGGLVGSNPGPSWHVKRADDFNGDGKSDILWQNDSGQVAIWTMNGLSQLGGSLVGSNPGASWQVVASVQ